MGRDGGGAMPYNWAAHKQLIMEEKLASWPDLKGNLCFLDLVINGNTEKTMRLVFALFMDECPLAACNFHAFCTQRFPQLGDGGAPMTYRRSKASRKVRGQFLQTGDVCTRGGDSIYGGSGFEDEEAGLRMRHQTAGLLSCVNHGPNTNSSRFFITLGPCPALDGNHVVFGSLVSGGCHLQALDEVPVDSNDAPLQRVEIAECGALDGWERPARPLPDAGAATTDVSISSLNAKAEETGAGIAAAVAAGLSSKRAAAPAADPAAKRPAASSSSGAGMLALPDFFGGDEDDSDGEP
jgi:cyclophilin family peptidyl-prolyl cis-trans isomerase